jgi:hypothetical protein
MKNYGSVLRDLVAVVGGCAAIYGVSLIYEPLAWIVGGLMTLAACVAHATMEDN